MPIYENETRTREDLEKLRKANVCQVCGEWLNMFLDRESGLAFVACHDWLRTHHEGIMREASPFQQKGLESLTIKARREIMEERLGKGTTTALEARRLPTSGALTQPQAMHILKLVYPNVPEDEIIRCAILCRDFGLHPLMKEVYIIGFTSKKTGKKTYSTVIGIGATRKMSSNKGTYSYLDDTPRAAVHQEIVKQYGEDSEEERDNLVSICKLKGDKDNEAIGFGLWPKDSEPYGVEKGNTKRNMANIRSERQAHDRLSGTSLPRGVEVIDEAYVDAETIGKVDRATDEITEGEFKEVAEESKEIPTAEQLEAEAKAKAKTKESESKIEEIKEGPAKIKAVEPEKPKPNTIEELKETMQLCNWSAQDAGRWCNSKERTGEERGWNIREYSDLKPDQIVELIAYIKKNPK